MTVAIIAVIAVLLVLGVGYLIFALMRKSQKVVPEMADPKHTAERVVGVDEQGRQITEAAEPREPARDAGAFESLLQDEIHDLGREQPAADDEA
jgi:hypothetical protein